jgi:hypothetical protein
VWQAEKTAEIITPTILTDQIQEEFLQMRIETQRLTDQLQTEVTIQTV